MGGNVDLLANSKIKIGKEKAIGLYMGGTSQVVTADMNSTFIMRMTHLHLLIWGQEIL